MKKINVGLLVFLTIIQSVFSWNPFISPQKVEAWITELKDIPDQKKSYILNKISNEYVPQLFNQFKIPHLPLSFPESKEVQIPSEQ